jgi:type II secretory pathway component PulF
MKLLPTTLPLAILAVSFHVLISYLLYRLLSLPLRRQERTRLFLDLLEAGLADGRSPEQTIIALGESGDRLIGFRYRLLAAHLRQGVRFGEALRNVPVFCAPQIRAMLDAGDKLGDMPRVLPACRAAASNASSRLVSAANYLLVLVVAITPAALAVLTILTAVIGPKLTGIFGECLTVPPPLFKFFVNHPSVLVGGYGAVMSLLYLAALVYITGPWLTARFAPVFGPVADAFCFWLPWRRKRMQRDFSAMLAILLDAGVPEAEALRLAAASTANRVFIRRAERAAQNLREGARLTDAVAALDDTGEFRWRLTNAAHGSSGLVAALAGWQDALDAKAYQLEQAWSQLITTGLVLFNGLIVALVAAGVFQALTATIQGAALW